MHSHSLQCNSVSSCKSHRQQFYHKRTQTLCLPLPLRNLSGVSVTTFKAHFDKFLRTIPGEPGVSGYVKYRAATTYSLIDQVAYFNQQSWHASVSQKMDILPAEGLEN